MTKTICFENFFIIRELIRIAGLYEIIRLVLGSSKHAIELVPFPVASETVRVTVTD